MREGSFLQPEGWTERTRLLPKAMSYAFSVDLRLAAIDAGPRFYLQAEAPSPEAAPSATFHVLGNQTLTTAYGAHEEVPACRLVQGFAEIVDDRGTDSASITGKLTFSTQQFELWRAELRGVVSPRGGVSTLRDVSGRPVSGAVFWSSRNECAQPRLRWLTRHQLFWVGHFEQAENVRSDRRSLELTFDVYTAG